MEATLLLLESIVLPFSGGKEGKDKQRGRAFLMNRKEPFLSLPV